MNGFPGICINISKREFDIFYFQLSTIKETGKRWAEG